MTAGARLELLELDYPQDYEAYPELMRRLGLPDFARESWPGPSLVYVRPDASVAAVAVCRQSGPRTTATVLVGPGDDLTPTVALGLHDPDLWPRHGDLEEVDGRGRVRILVDVEPIRSTAAAQVDVLAARATAMVDGAGAEVDPVTAVVAAMLAKPHDRVLVRGCPPEDRAALLWAVHETGRNHDPGMPRRRWQFSTHQPEVDLGRAELPDISFVERVGVDALRSYVGVSLVDLSFPHAPGDIDLQAAMLVEEVVAPVRRRPVRVRRRTRPAGPPGPAPGWYLDLARPGTSHLWDGTAWAGQRVLPTTVFVSYARRDEEPVRALVEDLRAARLPVWLDEELEIGEVWWEEILQRIRDAAVFVHAVSDASLTSAPCRAERTYAEALGIPVVPVQVGDANLLVTDVGRIQLVDHRGRAPRQIARLVADVVRKQVGRGPLPKPLPPSPPVPFGYLLRLTTELRATEISVPDQQRILDELGRYLDDETADDVRATVLALLTTLAAHGSTANRISRMARGLAADG